MRVRWGGRGCGVRVEAPACSVRKVVGVVAGARRGRLDCECVRACVRGVLVSGGWGGVRRGGLGGGVRGRGRVRRGLIRVDVAGVVAGVLGGGFRGLGGGGRA